MSGQLYEIECIDKEAKDKNGIALFGKTKKVYAIDAKESIGTGRYKAVGDPPKGLLRDGEGKYNPKGTPLDVAAAKELPKEGPPPSAEGEPVAEHEKFATMNTNELVAYHQSLPDKIEGFTMMNMAEKQQALAGAHGG